MSFYFHIRPVDRSLQAYKDWMQSLVYPLRPNPPKTVLTKLWLDEQTWVANWMIFWALIDLYSESHGPGEWA